MKARTIEQSLLDRLFEGLLEIDNRGRISTWNKAAECITGYAPDRVLGKEYCCSGARQVDENGAELPEARIPILLTAKDGRPREALTYVSHADGFCLRTLTRTEAVRDDRGRIVGALEIFTDNKALIGAFQASQRTEETVHFDALTGIGNRPHIETKIRVAMAEYRLRHVPFGILFIDVDHFKDFNDNYGHLLGDKILRAAAVTLRQHLRGSDSCGRWGGEEFVALVHDLDGSALVKVAEKLRLSVAATKVPQDGRELGVTVSIGATLVRPDDSFPSLLERADRLMYESKRLGRDRVTVDG